METMYTTDKLVVISETMQHALDTLKYYRDVLPYNEFRAMVDGFAIAMATIEGKPSQREFYNSCLLNAIE